MMAQNIVNEGHISNVMKKENEKPSTSKTNIHKVVKKNGKDDYIKKQVINTKNNSSLMVKERPVGKWSSIEEFSKNGFSEIVEATKAVNAYPQGATRDLYCSFPAFGRVIDDQSTRILELISNVMKMQNIRGNIQYRQQLDDKFELLLDFNDHLFERIQEHLDVLEGIKKLPEIVPEETKVINKNMEKNNNASEIQNQKTTKGNKNWSGYSNTKKAQNKLTSHLIKARYIEKPQLNFVNPVDNSLETPFIPRLKDKPNSLKPLAILPEYNEQGEIISYLHPYEFELLKFDPPESLLCRKEISGFPTCIESTSYLYVDTLDKLLTTINELRGINELAIDVEHHCYRSFLGLTCLVQMSSREKDYVFDALQLRENMHLLNEILTNPKIVKILHGADSDVLWLQRDLSLYIVNMFDTHIAAKALQFSKLSLAYLLFHYCEKVVDKTFQLADWRLRPLPDELITYARLDTRYLIYIYERINNDLIDASNGRINLLRTVYQQSKDLCLKRYEKPVMGPRSFNDLYRKSKKTFDKQQLFALKELYLWRDNLARTEDESYQYVMPDHMLLQVASNLPREAQGVIACCNPVPVLVRKKLHEIHQIIYTARQQPLEKQQTANKTTDVHKCNVGKQPSLEKQQQNLTTKQQQQDQQQLTSSSLHEQRFSLLIQQKIKLHQQQKRKNTQYYNKLYCPHDFSHQDDICSNLPKSSNNNKISIEIKTNSLTTQKEIKSKYFKANPDLLYFCGRFQNYIKLDLQQDETSRCKKNNMNELQMPYKRYLAALINASKEKNEKEKQLINKQTELEKQNKNNEDDDNKTCNNNYKINTEQETETKNDNVDNNVIQVPLKRKWTEEVPSTNEDNLQSEISTKLSSTRISQTNTITDNNITLTNANTKSKRRRKRKQTNGSKNEVLASSTSNDFLSLSVSDIKNETNTTTSGVANNINKQFGLTGNNSTQQNDQSSPDNAQKKYKWFRSENTIDNTRSNKSKSFQSSDKEIHFTNGNFDYNNVDYSKFKGGAQRTDSTTIRSKWFSKGKMPKAENKKFNKFFTFTKVNVPK